MCVYMFWPDDFDLHQLHGHIYHIYDTYVHTHTHACREKLWLCCTVVVRDCRGLLHDTYLHAYTHTYIYTGKSYDGAVELWSEIVEAFYDHAPREAEEAKRFCTCMHVFMYVCMYVCMETFYAHSPPSTKAHQMKRFCTYIHVCAAHLYMTHMYTCLYVCMYMYAFSPHNTEPAKITSLCRCIHAYACTWPFLYICMHVCVYMYVCVCVYIYIYMYMTKAHTYACIQPKLLVCVQLWNAGIFGALRSVSGGRYMHSNMLAYINACMHPQV
jgi:hypothetical protein